MRMTFLILLCSQQNTICGLERRVMRFPRSYGRVVIKLLILIFMYCCKFVLLYQSLLVKEASVSWSWQNLLISQPVYLIRPYGAPLAQCEHRMAHVPHAFCSSFLSSNFNVVAVSPKCEVIGPVIYPGGAVNVLKWALIKNPAVNNDWRTSRWACSHEIYSENLSFFSKMASLYS